MPMAEVEALGERSSYPPPQPNVRDTHALGVGAAPAQNPTKSALVSVVPAVTVANRIAAPAPLPSAS